MDVETPPLSADEPLNRHAPTVSPEPVASLAVLHLVVSTASIELGPALPKTEQRGVAA